MQKSWTKILALMISLIIVSNLKAHVGLDYPEGGETFFVGDTVNIEWNIFINHDQNNWDLYFSPDGGVTWQTIQLDLPVPQTNYQWIVPDILTENAQIRIQMDNIGANYGDISANFTIAGAQLEIKDETNLPKMFSLKQNFPNPFNPSTTINYNLPQSAEVTIIVYDMIGKEIKTLVHEYKNAGYHSVIWNATNNAGNRMSGGVYFYNIHAGSYQKTQKMVLLK